MKKILGFVLTLVVGLGLVWAGEPDGYYKSADGLRGFELKTALFRIIKAHKQLSYNELWEAYTHTDVRADGLVWDMYTNCDFTFDQHNGQNTADCVQINREHSFPKSWFGGEVYPMYTDLFHLYPVDGYTNSRRSNWPYAEVDEATARYVSSNGSRLGNSVTEGYSGTAFELIDEYKGDLARTYFYMATCYENKIASWNVCQQAQVCNGTRDTAFRPWLVALLLKWHALDPVSEKELNRNDSVYMIQNNRNPFIDYPELVEKIWGSDTSAFRVEYPEPAAVAPSNEAEPFEVKLYPNPNTGYVKVVVPENSTIEIVNAGGAVVRSRTNAGGEQKFRLSDSGLYLVRVTCAGRTVSKKMVVK